MEPTVFIVTSKPLISQTFTLEKFPGKGGWTYVVLPGIKPAKHTPFGWVRVRGFIDSFELNNYKLMPMKAGTLFLPVRAEIRKKIGKVAGDEVKVELYLDERPLGIPDEILDCFDMEDPKLRETFLALKEFEQKAYLDWIFDAKKGGTKAERIAKMMERLQQDKKLLS